MLNGKAQHLVIPLSHGSKEWKGAVLQRLGELDPRLVPLVDSMRCELNGKEITEDYAIEELHDAVLRWRSSGLLGGARTCRNQYSERETLTT